MPGDTPEVLTAGAGPVGLFAAYDLARRGIRVQLVDTGLWPCTHAYALALHPQSLRLMRDTGLFARVMESAYPVYSVGFYEGRDRKAVLRLDEGSGPGMAVLRQDALEKTLEHALGERQIRVGWRNEVSRIQPGKDSVSVGIDQFEQESRGYIVAHNEWVVSKSSELEVPYLIGADGYNSRVRRELGSEFPEIGPAQYFAVFEFQSDARAENEVRVVLDETTTNVLWPMPGGAFRWSFQIPSYADAPEDALKARLHESGFGDFPTRRVKDRMMSSGATEYPELDEAALRKFIAERAPWFEGSIENIGWRTVIRFERRLATGFGSGRLFLAGDSAHLAGPVGVQSMNLGLHEAHDLAGLLEGTLRAETGAAPLAGFSPKWTAIWRQLAGVDSKLAGGPQTDPWIASRAERILACLPAHGEELVALAGRLGLAFSKGSAAS